MIQSDIGIRDYVSGTPSRHLPLSEPYTLLWKSYCNRRLHQRLLDNTPDIPLQATYFRSFLLRDAGTYTSKVKQTRTTRLGHPESRQLGIPRAKAYHLQSRSEISHYLSNLSGRSQGLKISSLKENPWWTLMAILCLK